MKSHSLLKKPLASMVCFTDIYHYFGILTYMQTVLFRCLRCIFYQDTVTVDCFIPEKQPRGPKCAERTKTRDL